MHAAFTVHALAQSVLTQHAHRAVFEQASADALHDMFARRALKDDRVDASAMQDVRQHQARWPAADDHDLGAPLRHGCALGMGPTVCVFMCARLTT